MVLTILFTIAVVVIIVVLVALGIIACHDEEFMMYYRNSSSKVLKQRLRNVKWLVRSRRFKWIGKIGKTKPGDGYKTMEPIDEATYLSKHHSGKGIPAYWVTIGENQYVTISIDGHILLDNLNRNVEMTFILVDNSIKNAVRFLDEKEDKDDEE